MTYAQKKYGTTNNKHRPGSMRRTFLGAAAFLVSLVPLSPPVHAVELPEELSRVLTCDLRSSLIKELKDGYAEKPVALGVTNAGTVIELWTARDGKTWTLMVTMDGQNSCVLGAGDNWMEIHQSARGKIL